MALNFPSAPADGDVYDNWVYSSAKGAWLAKPLEPTTAVTSDTAPPNPIDGDMWFNTLDGTTYVWFDDGDTSQWVEMVAPITANGYYSPNYIINGGFDINQRGFTSTTTSGAVGFDRWGVFLVGATATYSAQVFPVGTKIGQDEPENYARIVTSGQSGATVDTRWVQRIEDVALLSGKTITVSFWARSGSGSPSVSIEIAQNFGTGGSPSASVTGSVATNTVKKINLSGGTSWTRYNATLSVPSISGKTIGTDVNSSYTSFGIFVSAGSDYNIRTDNLGIQSNTFDIWGVQLEEGSVATPFRRNANSIQGELAACQRYYQRWTATNTASRVAGGQGTTTTLASLDLPLGVDMRIVPALEYSSNSDWSLLTGNTAPVVTGITISSAATTRSASMLATVASGLTPGYYAGLRANTAAAWIAMNSEL